jgi:hypothetical protein
MPLSHSLAVAPKNHAARESVIGVQVSLVAATGVQVSGVPAMGSHFSMADVAKLNAMVDVELPSNTRATDVVRDKLDVNAADPVTLNTALAVVVKVELIVACALSCGLAPTVIVDVMAIVAVLCSMLSLRP